MGEQKKTDIPEAVDTKKEIPPGPFMVKKGWIETLADGQRRTCYVQEEKVSTFEEAMKRAHDVGRRGKGVRGKGMNAWIEQVGSSAHIPPLSKLPKKP